MSRSGYHDNSDDQWSQIMWSANVRRCIAGRKGQAFLWELYGSLEALPRHELITGGLVDQHGSVCALGAVAISRGVEIPDELRITDEGDADDYDFQEAMGSLLGIKDMLAREVMYYNDEFGDRVQLDGPPKPGRYYWSDCPSSDFPYRGENAAERWQRMRRWVVSRLRDIP